MHSRVRNILKILSELSAKVFFFCRVSFGASAPWSLDSNGVVAVYLNSTMGFGDYLMLSPLLGALERSNCKFVVVATKFHEVLSGFPVISEDEFVNQLRNWSLVILPDLSFRKPILLLRILCCSRFIGFPFDLKLRNSWDKSSPALDSVGSEDPWQRRVELISRRLGLASGDNRYHVHLSGTDVAGSDATAKLHVAPRIVFSPFSFPEFRQFSEDFMARVQQRLCSEGFIVTMIGEARFSHISERVICDGVANRVGKTTFEDMIYLVRNATGFIGLDSGPMHLSLAFRIPTLGLFKAVEPSLRVPSDYSEIFYSFYPCGDFVKTPCYKPGVGYPFTCYCSQGVSWSKFSPILEAFIESIKKSSGFRV
jgi:ADP-heptose:LPS heptosyltransferase